MPLEGRSHVSNLRLQLKLTFRAGVPSWISDRGQRKIPVFRPDQKDGGFYRRLGGRLIFRFHYGDCGVRLLPLKTTKSPPRFSPANSLGPVNAHVPWRSS
jgi:hypothetical protein